MKTQLTRSLAATLSLAAAGVLLAQPTPFGTVFTYQGRLNVDSMPATGLYDFQFSLSNAPSGGSFVGGPITRLAVGVTNGIFTTSLDFGPVFAGNATWLAISVRSNNVGIYAPIAPLQELTPVPYAIMASGASNLLGTLPVAQLNGTVANGQLLNSSMTVNAGAGLTGGGTVVLGGSTTLNNAGVISVTGPGDITATTVGGAVTLGDTATSADTANLIVKRDNSGSFSAGSVTLAGDLTLPATSGGAGIIYSGSGLFMHAYGTQNFFAGVGAGNLTLGGAANTGVGWQALFSDTSGDENAAIGTAALEFDTSGRQNSAIGNGAMEFNSSGGQNTASGTQTLRNNTTGSYNTANGAFALYNNTNGAENVASGYEALYNNVNGGYNTAYGDSALFANMNGSFNVANGYLALQNSTGSHNAAVGWGALENMTGGAFNTALGALAGANVTTGSNNIHIGNTGLTADDSVIRIGTPGVQTATYLVGTVNVPVLNITGGADLAEPFPMSSAAIPKGSVVIIDEKHPGELKRSEQAYDHRVAGIVSGANGVKPGISLHQVNVLNGDQNVALSGRVYVLADTSNGSIHPGDLLTTSVTPGNAMKATDYSRAQGAILGKAMTGLSEREGMVLVLVTLQ